MKTMIMLLLTLGLAACGGKNASKPYYKLVSSSCNAPETNLNIIEELQDGTDVHFAIAQSVPAKQCNFFAQGILTVQGNTLTSKNVEISQGTNCEGTPLFWDEVYTYSKNSNQLSLSSNSCTMEFELK